MFQENYVKTKNVIKCLDMMDMIYYSFVVKSGVLKTKELQDLSLEAFEIHHEKIKC